MNRSFLLSLEAMDAASVTDPRSAFLCSRLHLRNGKRRFHQGYSAAGIVSLYDSLLFGMCYYIATHKHCKRFIKNTELWDATSLFHALFRAGVFDDPLFFNRLSLIVERALWQATYPFDADSNLAEVEKMLMKLGVIPVNGFGLLANY